MASDTERLDWLTGFCDKGVISLDYDLEGCPKMLWSAFNEAGEGFTNPRDAIDAAMKKSEEQLQALGLAGKEDDT